MRTLHGGEQSASFGVAADRMWETQRETEVIWVSPSLELPLNVVLILIAYCYMVCNCLSKDNFFDESGLSD